MTLSTFPVVTNQPKTQVTLPIGTHVLELVVADSAGLTSEPDRVTITVVSQGVPPLIAGISPNSGLPGETINATITGSGLSGATAVTFEHTGVTATTKPGDSAEELPITIAISSLDKSVIGKWRVTVRTPAGSTTSSTPLFEVKTAAQPPEITGITPVSGMQNTTIPDAAISGKNLLGATAVSFDGTGVTVTPRTDGTAATLPVQIEIAQSAPAGKRRVTVVTPAGSGSSDPIFEVKAPVLPPEITGIDLTHEHQGATKIPVKITGKNLLDAKNVTFGDRHISAEIQAEGAADTLLPIALTIGEAARVGPHTYTVTTPSGTADGPAPFTVYVIGGKPVIAGVSITSVIGLTVLTMSVTGQYLIEVKQITIEYQTIRGWVIDNTLVVAGSKDNPDGKTLQVSLRVVGTPPSARRRLTIVTTFGEAQLEFTPTLPRSVAEVNGIGSVLTEKLAQGGIGELSQLAAADPKVVASAMGVSEARASEFIKEAKRLLRS